LVKCITLPCHIKIGTVDQQAVGTSA